MNDSKSRVLVTGGNGQLGCSMVEMSRQCPSNDLEVIAIDRARADITDRRAVEEVVEEVRPDILVNAAAYTAVDAAESNPDIAMEVNGSAVLGMAEVCLARGIRFVQVSTDFVFGEGHHDPIKSDSKPAPLSVYGRSKLDGERACLEVLGPDAIVVRTSWLYAAGHRNFVATMVGLMRSRDEIRVVDDQVGSPTWAPSLARGIAGLIRGKASGIFHLTDAGEASWYQFATAIQEIGMEVGIFDSSCLVKPISTSEYPTPAIRPSYSVLDKSESFEFLDGPTEHWRSNLEKCLASWASSNVL